MLTFITKVLHLIDTAKYFNPLFLWLVQCQLCIICQAFMTHSVTKATLIHFVDIKCDLKFSQSHRVIVTPYHATVC